MASYKTSALQCCLVVGLCVSTASFAKAQQRIFGSAVEFSRAAQVEQLPIGQSVPGATPIRFQQSADAPAENVLPSDEGLLPGMAAGAAGAAEDFDANLPQANVPMGAYRYPYSPWYTYYYRPYYARPWGNYGYPYYTYGYQYGYPSYSPYTYYSGYWPYYNAPAWGTYYRWPVTYGWGYGWGVPASYNGCYYW